MTVCDEESDKYQQTVQKFREGCDKAFNELWLCHKSDVEIYLSRRAYGRNDAEDVAQETWIKVWENRAELKHTNFRAWLLTIAGRHCIDQQRKDGALKRQPSETVGALHENSEPADKKLNHDSDDERVPYLRECLEELQLKNSAVFRTYDEFILGKIDTASLAAKTGIKRGTVHSRVSRAKELLRECIEKKMSQT